ncbi:MAG: hypothetical protein HQL71_01260 [Magnetococcales bacterium]|nr:hypothetical protein [Magnetococcales bacterium]
MLKLNKKQPAFNNADAEKENKGVYTRNINTIPAIFQLGNGAVSYAGVTNELSLKSIILQAETASINDIIAEEILSIEYENYEFQYSAAHNKTHGIALSIFNNNVTLTQFLP